MKNSRIQVNSNFKKTLYLSSNFSIAIFGALFLCFLLDVQLPYQMEEYRNLFVVLYLVLRLFYYQSLIKEQNRIIAQLKANLSTLKNNSL